MNLQKLRELEEKRTQGRWWIGHISEIIPNAVDIDSADGAIADNVYGSYNQIFICEFTNHAKALLDVVEAAKEVQNLNKSLGAHFWSNRINTALDDAIKCLEEI